MTKRAHGKHEGDILGLGSANPNVPLPFRPRRDRRHPQGIEVGQTVTGIGDVPQRTGASGADLGGREGVDVTPGAPDVEERPEGTKD